jgi:hypothetical protein
MAIRAIDPWVNVNMGEQRPPEYLIRVKEDYFKGGDEFFKNIEVEQLIDDMDAAGVEKAILSIGARKPSPHSLAFAEKHPDRFAFAVNLGPSGSGTCPCRSIPGFPARRCRGSVRTRCTWIGSAFSSPNSGCVWRTGRTRGGASRSG